MENTKLLEAQLIFSVISNPKWTDEFLSLEKEDFYFYPHLFTLIQKLHEEGKHIDYGLIYSLDKSIKEVVEVVVSEDNFGLTIIPNKKIFEERIETLKELSLKRKIEQESINELDLEILKQKLEEYHKKGSARWLTGEDIRNLAYEILQNKKQSTTIYHLGILDKATGGIEKGQYIIVAGRPSVGKSAFLQYVGLENAKKGKKVLFVSVEMSEEMITSRILKTYKPHEIPLTFNILNASSIPTIEAEISKKARDFDLILVDYIQLLQPRKKIIKDLYERVTEVSGEIKKMATKFNLPFICASQFSRRAENTQPSLADLKESGALEQDADVVISLWKEKGDAELLEDKTTAKIRVDLLKNRNGWTFSNMDGKEYSVIFKKDEFRFYEVENIT
ncbi:MAG: hypothetical protein NC917_07105 [Candidatus Omnitrophica bacterium]|nr:hypothetical protein [Candidatus Omnitrophota bacterium]